MRNAFTIRKSSFHWEYTEEPHKSRRVEILSKHPEIKQLMKAEGDRRLALVGIFLMILQLFSGYMYYVIPYAPLKFLFITCYGTWISTMISLHEHEAAHGLVFGPNHIWKNRLYGMVINLALAVPMYSFFKRHHKRHHKALGDEILDAEYPSEFEAKFFPPTPAGKYLWLLAQPIIYCIRTPVFIVERFTWEWDLEESINAFSVLTFDIVLLCCGHSQMLNYLTCATMISSQTHMAGFWGNMSHIEFIKMKETSSYYGWMNKVYLNFGYHMEHHDFPNVPSKYLPKIKEIAPEYYEDQIVLDSYIVAAVKFIFDSRIGVNSRLKRENESKYKKIQ